MPDANPQDTLDTNASEMRRNRFEAVWLAWRVGESLPRWQDHLPADDEPCNSQLIFDLLEIDIECRIKAALPALLVERYFEHPRLQREDARLTAEHGVDLIRWEYQQRWQQRDPASRADYEAAFPQHADALRDLKPTWHCPRCRKSIVLEETMQTVVCPDCGSESGQHGVAPPFVPVSTSPASPRTVFDPRGYQLIEQLGKGGMGEVYRCGDPALGRDLAIKVMKAEYLGIDEAANRFLREARITGSLQHPSIVPIHNLGRLTDGRLHYTMRLVRGQTFAAILKEEAGKPARLPYLLSIFEKICQAVAYAHSKRVIHRDLKPHNVMVGRFGEVQVMDWGLAKLLTTEDAAASAETIDAAITRIPIVLSDTPIDLTRTGSAMGTLAYMPPEQALGEKDMVDERADVFALGSILCEMLSGQPAYSGKDGNEVYRRTKRGDVTEALERLQQCGADAPLTALCRECLSPERESRPRDADIVAKRVAEYQAEVQERLQRAQVERVAAEIRAREEQARALVEQERTREALARVKAERRLRRRTLALAAAVMILVVGGGGAFWWQQHQREKADLAVSNGLTHADLLAEQARADPLQTDKYYQALEAARVAAQLAEGASVDARRRAEEMITRLEQEEKAGRKDKELLAALLDVRSPHEGPKYVHEEKGMMMPLAEPTADEQFAAAFRTWGLDVDGTPTAKAAALLKVRPPQVVTEIIAALDEWTSERRKQGKRKAEWQRLMDLAVKLDEKPNSMRQELAAILMRDRLPVERVLGTLSAALRPVPVPVALSWGEDRLRLRQLAHETDLVSESVLSLLTLTRALQIAGEDALAERLLREAVQARPREVVLYHTLGHLFEKQKPPRWAEAVECYTAARALRPDLGVSLAEALRRSGRETQGLALLAQLVREKPDNPYLHFSRGIALYYKGDLDSAIVCFQKAIDLNRKDAEAHNGLGAALYKKHDLDGAIACWRRAIDLDFKDDMVHSMVFSNLGAALSDKSDLDGAIVCLHKAIDLDRKHAGSHINLGNVLRTKGHLDEAIAEYHRAIEIDPELAEPHRNLGLTLNDKHDLDGAIACFRKAIALKPDYANAYTSLGIALCKKHDWDGAIVCFRKAIELDPRDAQTHYNLGNALDDNGKATEAETAYRKAITLKPDFINAYHNLGICLNRQEKHGDAEVICRKAIALNTDDADAYNELGVALSGQGKCGEAEEAFRKTIALKPDYAKAIHNLGATLADKHDLDGAISFFRKAIALKPDYAKAYYNLGNALHEKHDVNGALDCYKKTIEFNPKHAKAHHKIGIALYDKGRLDEAIAEYQQSIALDPKNAQFHTNLGNALDDKGRLEEAIAEYRKAVDLDPRNALSHYNFGVALDNKGDLDGAIACYKKAIALNPKDGRSHSRLGNALHFKKHDLDGAIASYRKAIELKPKEAGYHNNLGLALREKGCLEEAIAASHQAIQLDPKYAQAHISLGLALLQQGQFTLARQSVQRCLELLPTNHPLREYALLQLRKCEQMIALEKKLAAIDEGDGKPVDAAEQISLAELCQLKKRHAAASRFFAAAFAVKPKLVDDPGVDHRYNASRSTVLAAAGKSQDAAKLDDKERAALRKQALDWLRADLTYWSKHAESEKPAAFAAVRQTLQNWQRDPDLASIRDPQPLDSLPENERAAWHALWRDVDELAKRAAKQDKAGEKREKRQAAQRPKTGSRK